VESGGRERSEGADRRTPRGAWVELRHLQVKWHPQAAPPGCPNPPVCTRSIYVPAYKTLPAAAKAAAPTAEFGGAILPFGDAIRPPALRFCPVWPRHLLPENGLQQRLKNSSSAARPVRAPPQSAVFSIAMAFGDVAAHRPRGTIAPRRGRIRCHHTFKNIHANQRWPLVRRRRISDRRRRWIRLHMNLRGSTFVAMPAA